MNAHNYRFQSVFNNTSSFLCGLVIFMAFVFCSCSDASGPSYGNNSDNENSPGPNEVWMVDQSFTPSTLQVQVGAVVTWTNKSDLIHTVTSGEPGEHDGMFDSGDISPGSTFSYTFNETGTYQYYCIPHEPSMTGRVIVRDSDDGY